VEPDRETLYGAKWHIWRKKYRQLLIEDSLLKTLTVVQEEGRAQECKMRDCKCPQDPADLENAGVEKSGVNDNIGSEQL